MSQPEVAQPDFRFSLRMALAAVAIVACAVALIVELNQRGKETRRVRWLTEYIPGAMTELGINLRRYGGVKVFDTLPEKELGPWPPVSPADDAGQPLSSWRLQVSPYFAVGGPPPKLDVNAKWDAPVNDDYVREMGGLFCLNGTRRDTTTHVFGLAGSGSAIDAKTVSHYSQLPSDTRSNLK